MIGFLIFGRILSPHFWQVAACGAWRLCCWRWGRCLNLLRSSRRQTNFTWQPLLYPCGIKIGAKAAWSQWRHSCRFQWFLLKFFAWKLDGISALRIGTDSLSALSALSVLADLVLSTFYLWPKTWNHRKRYRFHDFTSREKMVTKFRLFRLRLRIFCHFQQHKQSISMNCVRIVTLPHQDAAQRLSPFGTKHKVIQGASEKQNNSQVCHSLIRHWIFQEAKSKSLAEGIWEAQWLFQGFFIKPCIGQMNTHYDRYWIGCIRALCQKKLSTDLPPRPSPCFPVVSEQTIYEYVRCWVNLSICWILQIALKSSKYLPPFRNL